MAMISSFYCAMTTGCLIYLQIIHACIHCSLLHGCKHVILRYVDYVVEVLEGGIVKEGSLGGGAMSKNLLI